MAKRQTTGASARVQPTATALAREADRMQTQTREAAQAIQLRQQAELVTVSDRESHAQALEFVRAGKQIKRLIETHWQEITRADDEAKRKHLDQKNRELGPVLEAIAIVEKRALDYANEQARIEREKAEADRRERERRAEEERQRELAEAEARALKFEQDSPVLSAREQRFVELYIDRPIDAVRHANTVGYKDYRAAAERLLASQKIQDAIQAKRTALAIRQQAEATRQQPLKVERAAPAPSQVAKVAGVRNTTSRTAEVFDLDKLIDGVIAGTVDRKALTFDQTFLNSEARQLQDSFESVYPGCRLVTKHGLAG